MSKTTFIMQLRPLLKCSVDISLCSTSIQQLLGPILTVYISQPAYLHKSNYKDVDYVALYNMNDLKQ